jgi:error-prone DNA polymerase
MRLAVEAAGFTPGEADQLRRAMGAWRRPGLIEQFRQRLIEGMRQRHLQLEWADRVFEQIRGFGDYGFPESHAASFALLVYVSAYLKHHYPAAFSAALLNSQPMGFYAPAQLVRNAREHGVEVRGVDVNVSDWDCTLERGLSPFPPQEPVSTNDRDAEMGTVPFGSTTSLRLGFNMLRRVAQSDARRIEQARGDRPFVSLEDFKQRTGLSRAVIARLAKADAFASLALDRRSALWHALAQQGKDLPLLDRLAPAHDRPQPALPDMSAFDAMLADYRAGGLSLTTHPMQFLRRGLDELGVVPAAQLDTWPNGRPIRVAGVVLVRQRPATAKGVTFVTLEDETGTINLLVRLDVWSRFRQAAATSTVMLARGRLQREGPVIHVIVSRLEDLSGQLRELASQSRDFC